MLLTFVFLDRHLSQEECTRCCVLAVFVVTRGVAEWSAILRQRRSDCPDQTG